MQVRAPDGLARTHRFSTASVDIPAQACDRITVISAAPSSAAVKRGLGPFKTSARTPGTRPGEPLAIHNHATDRVSFLSRPPPKSAAPFDASWWFVPAALLLASSDAAMALIDPGLPRAVAVGVGVAVAVGGGVNAFVVPRLNQVLLLFSGGKLGWNFKCFLCVGM